MMEDEDPRPNKEIGIEEILDEGAPNKELQDDFIDPFKLH